MWKSILRQRMLTLDLTQEQLANRIGASQSAVSKWLRGENDIGVEELQRIAQSVGLKTADFFVNEVTVRHHFLYEEDAEPYEELIEAIKQNLKKASRSNINELKAIYTISSKLFD